MLCLLTRMPWPGASGGGWACGHRWASLLLHGAAQPDEEGARRGEPVTGGSRHMHRRRSCLGRVQETCSRRWPRGEEPCPRRRGRRRTALALCKACPIACRPRYTASPTFCPLHPQKLRAPGFSPLLPSSCVCCSAAHAAGVRSVVGVQAQRGHRRLPPQRVHEMSRVNIRCEPCCAPSLLRAIAKLLSPHHGKSRAAAWEVYLDDEGSEEVKGLPSMGRAHGG